MSSNTSPTSTTADINSSNPGQSALTATHESADSKRENNELVNTDVTGNPPTGATKQKILIVDDSEMNRSILSDMLDDEFDIIEATDGEEAVIILEKASREISLVLLDIVMPNMDGFEVLAMMNKYHWIEDAPVIMISAENTPSYVERAYELGVTDFINRPFDARVVHHRVINTIMLYAKQRRLIDLVADQIYEREKSSSLMVSILSHIVEFRNGESGLHVLHINTMTELLLRALVKKTDRYHLSRSDIALISTASALHDIGKISIPNEILNKPGRLTDREFAIMKTHSAIGASMLQQLPLHQNEPLVKMAYAICRWHHERYDGRGYPDGLVGEEIPIAAQVVALADVYDALTSERVYKAAIPHEKALEMIYNGECGIFNPLLLDCLRDVADNVQIELRVNSIEHKNQREMRNVAEEMLQHEGLTASERTLHLLERERTKYQFFASMSREIQFEYISDPPMITLTEWGSQRLGLPSVMVNPLRDAKFIDAVGADNLQELADALRNTTPEDPIVRLDMQVMIEGEMHWHKVTCRATWSEQEPPRFLGAIGKAADIDDEHNHMADLQRKVAHDALTGLLNHTYASKRIERTLQEQQDRQFALAIIDLDHFKEANDRFGHIFGDHVLQYMAVSIQNNIRKSDICARIGGDEFLIFFQYCGNLEIIINRIFHALKSNYGDFPISVSMGIAKADEVNHDYAELFHCADRALYASKRHGRSQYCFYDNSMKDMLSEISSIEHKPTI